MNNEINHKNVEKFSKNMPAMPKPTVDSLNHVMLYATLIFFDEMSLL